MATRIIINGKEVSSPVSKALLILSAILITALATAGAGMGVVNTHLA